MSRESMHWLNTHTLIGYTDKRGKAWHSREGYDNHYAGAVPVDDVHKRLFDWQAVEVPEQWEYDGKVFVSERDKVIIRSDTGAKLGTFRNGYQPHQYGEWLVKNVANILDDSLQIGSAGLLKGGAVAWVSVEVPDNIVTPNGIEFRPHLLAVTSFDGSIATTYKRVVTNVVCDNTMAAGLREHGQKFKVKHSRKSMDKITEARDALGIVYEVADEFTEMTDELCQTTFTDAQFEALMDMEAPLTDEDGTPRKGRGLTMAVNKRVALEDLWNNDSRVTPWRGTAMGAWQAVNTYAQHEAIVRGAERQERNMLKTVDGTFEAADHDTIGKVLEIA